MKKHLAALLATAAIGMAIGTPAQADPPPWAPAHGYRAKQAQMQEYRYVYYPAQQVYYAPDQQMWFWMSGGNWQFGLNLPVQYRVTASAGVPIMLGSDQPYIEHAYVEETYGRPWREKHHGSHGGHGRHRD